MVTVRIPPHDIDAEQAVLGALLIDKEAFTSVSEKIKPEYFYDEKNKCIFECMLILYEERQPIDLLTLTSVLKKKKMFEKVGGSAYISSLTSVVPTASNIEHYCEIIREINQTFFDFARS